jgi:Flp pilus assembly CpaE family ATPase
MLSEVQAKGKAVEAISDIAGLVTGKAAPRIQKRSFLQPLISKLKPKAA